MNAHNPPVVGSVTTPKANFDIRMARFEPRPVDRNFKADYIKLAMLTELSAIQIAIDDQFPECFKNITKALTKLSTDDLLSRQEQIERRL